MFPQILCAFLAVDHEKVYTCTFHVYSFFCNTRVFATRMLIGCRYGWLNHPNSGRVITNIRIAQPTVKKRGGSLTLPGENSAT